VDALCAVARTERNEYRPAAFSGSLIRRIPRYLFHHRNNEDVFHGSERITAMSGQVLIIGAGIAGPALAIALRRAGYDAVIYEAMAAPCDEAGAFLNVAPNGLKALEALGLAGAIGDLGFLNDRLIFQNDAGRTLADVAVGGVTMRRGELSRALREAAMAAGAEVHFGKRLLTVEEWGGGVAARFSDGETMLGMALVGADGIHSRTRYSFFPEAPKPVYAGLLNLGGIVQTDLPPTGTAMRMIYGRHAFFGYAVRPDGETWWFSNYAVTDEPPRGVLEIVDGSVYRERLRQLHCDDPPEVTRILDAVRDDIGAWAVYDLASIPRWHRGKICLIGDASHAVSPHLGQGASLAIEDAFMLAKCIRDIRDPAAAFHTFERLRRDRVERVMAQSRRGGRRSPPTGGVTRAIRDLILPVFLKRAARATEWMYSYPMSWEERIPTAGKLRTVAPPSGEGRPRATRESST
jgi:2-polyprenyl-6-methoxyphenol hydroxylase-like FAD-dependent oxidoreductase